LLWMWGLDTTDSLLIRLAILLIALLTAYLTVVAIWNIPETPNTADQAAGQAAAAPNALGPYATNFGKTVIAGLTGLAVAEVAKALGTDQPSAGSRWFYIVWFIFFFFGLLFSFALLRAGAEGLRSIVALPRYALARPHGEKSWTYWWLRFWHWIFSFRV